MDKTILLIEDDNSIREAIQFVLDSEGYQIAVARDGEEGMSMLHNDLKPDVIILDIMMPVMNGFEFRKAQLNDPQLASIPTIALSADRNFHQQTHSGFQSVLKKPVELDDLLQSIESALHLS